MYKLCDMEIQAGERKRKTEKEEGERERAKRNGEVSVKVERTERSRNMCTHFCH